MTDEITPRRGDSLFHEHDGYPRHSLNVKDHDGYFERLASGKVEKPRKRSRTRAPKRQSAPRGMSPRDQVYSTLQMVNTIVVMIPPIADDALDELEIAALTDAIDAELQAHPEWRAWFERMSKASPHLMLFQVVAGILMVRLARRGLLPIPAGLMEGVTPDEAAVSVETGRASGADRGHWFGQVNDGGSPVASADASPDPALEA